MNILITHNVPVTAGQVHRLFRQTHWARERNVTDVAKMLAHNTLNIGAWIVPDEAASEGDDGQLVGYARLLTDWHYKAYVDDVIVDEAYRGKGIGRGLVQHVLDVTPTVEEVVLNCADSLVPFYAGIGFKTVDDQRLIYVRSSD